MSKNKNTNQSELIENESVEEPTQPTKPIIKEKKVGVDFYLQKKHLDFTVEQLMRKKYKFDVKTEKEWDETLSTLLGKKVIS